MEDKINSSKAPEPVGLYPHARKVGNLLFLSGVGPRERGTKIIPGVELDENGNITSYEIEKQCHSVFRNIKYILEDIVFRVSSFSYLSSHSSSFICRLKNNYYRLP